MKNKTPMIGFVLTLKPKNMEVSNKNIDKFKIMPILVNNHKEIEEVIKAEKEYDLVNIQSYSLLKKQILALESLASLNNVEIG